MKDAHVEPLLAQERLILDERQRHERLAQRKHELENELRALHEAIDETVRQLQVFGRERVDLGDLRRTSPISPVWGLDRGIPLDRYYIHRFLDRHRMDIRGRVLEIKDSGYTRMFGDDRVSTFDVLDIDASNARATMVADLSRADELPADTYDCFILTQTLGVVYDVAAALRHSLRILKPGGVLLCTLPAAGRISYEEGLDGDFWRFTEASVRRLFAAVAPLDAFEVNGHGNVLACAAFLYGLAPHELTPEELDAHDPYFPVVYTVRAVKLGAFPVGECQTPLGTSSMRRAASARSGAVLVYHGVEEARQGSNHQTVSPGEFQSHMRHLRDAGWRVLPLVELVESAAAGTLDGRSVSLTFDDGYLDALREAAPVLTEFGFPATFFVVGEALDGAHEYWWDALGRVFDTPRMPPGRLDLEWQDGRVSIPTSSAAERLAARRQVTEIFYSLNRRDRVHVLGRLVEWSGVGPRPLGARRPMTTEEVRRLADTTGMSIGAHSEHHVWLPSISVEEKREEILASRARLESVLGRPVQTFAYPYGAHDHETVALVREGGFTVAVTTEETPVTPGCDPLLVPRFEASGAQPAFVALLDRIGRP